MPWYSGAPSIISVGWRRQTSVKHHLSYMIAQEATPTEDPAYGIIHNRKGMPECKEKER